MRNQNEGLLIREAEIMTFRLTKTENGVDVGIPIKNYTEGKHLFK